MLSAVMKSSAESSVEAEAMGDTDRTISGRSTALGEAQHVDETSGSGSLYDIEIVANSMGVCIDTTAFVSSRNPPFSCPGTQILALMSNVGEKRLSHVILDITNQHGTHCVWWKRVQTVILDEE